MSQDVAIKGRPALLELLVDLTEESSALPEILSSQTGAVDLVPVLPHPPHGQPDLVDELGSPGVPSSSASNVGAVDLFMGSQSRGDSAHEEVFPSQSVLELDGLLKSPGALNGWGGVTAVPVLSWMSIRASHCSGHLAPASSSLWL